MSPDSPIEETKPVEAPKAAKSKKEKYIRCAAGRLKVSDMVFGSSYSQPGGSFGSVLNLCC